MTKTIYRRFIFILFWVLFYSVSGTGAATGPVLEETFPGLVFVHVRENPFLGARFGIRSIPVQVFYDKNGKEVFRHTGFLAEAEVMKQIEKMEVASK